MNEFTRYERQLILKEIGVEGQRRLAESRVAIVGLGALGSVSADLLARAGVGFLRLIDRDFLEINNLQRQVLYDEKDIQENLPKAIAAQRKLQKVNSNIAIEAQVSDVNPDSIDELLSDVDLIIDGTDNFETRFLLNDFSLRQRIPWIYGGALRTEGVSYVILPGEGPCLRCLFAERPNPGSFQTCDQVGVLAPVSHLIASFQTTEAIKILTGKKEAVDRKLWKVDLWNRRFQAVSVEDLKTNPCEGCRDKRYPYLAREIGVRTVTLCGRNAVQIYQSERETINFETLASRLAGQVEVEYNHYVLHISPKPYRITVFTNGRAIVKGTEDAGQAKSLYARYVGN